MDDDTDNESTPPEDFPSVSSARTVSPQPTQSGDDLDFVRENLASLDDWEGLPDLTSSENISDQQAAALTSEDDGWSDLGDNIESDHNDLQPGAEETAPDHGVATVEDHQSEDQVGGNVEPKDGQDGVTQSGLAANVPLADDDVIVLGSDTNGELDLPKLEDAGLPRMADVPAASEVSPASEVSEPAEDVEVQPDAPARPPTPQTVATGAPLPEPAPLEQHLFSLEMRQVAGLTAGSSMMLPPSKSFQFSETTTSSDSQDDGSTSFVLRVTDDGRVIVLPGTAKAIVNETAVEEPTFVGNGILSVGSACFAVRPVRAASSESALERAEVAMTAPKAITVGDMDGEAGAAQLLTDIGETRHQVAERHRFTHPDPEELKSRLTLMDPGLWERDREHRFFGRYSIGYAIIPWQPKFDDPNRIPEDLHEPINKMSVLPWVPVTASIAQGPIAIFGGRAAALAACRHAVLSLAALSAPGDIRFSVVTGRDRVDDWQWTKSLPELMSPTRPTNENGSGTDADPGYYQLSVVDGAEHLEPAGLSIGDSGPDSGLIVLGMDRSSVPDGCATYIGIADDGRATVTNHFNEEISATPIGVTEAFAHDMATRIADILIGYG